MTEQKIAVLFPGQGSQFLGMGREFLDTDPAARALMAEAEKISGFPLSRLCQDGPLEELTRTVHLQPAMTVMNLICWQALAKAGVRPAFFAGHSLGEYGALAAAGIVSPEDALALVTERGRLMERESAANPGGMQAVVKLPIQQVRAIVESARVHGRLTVANHNSAEQIVISGEIAALEAAAELVKKEGGKAIPLKVSGAWHSQLIQGAIPDFEMAMAKISFSSPHTPVLFNVTAAAESDPEAIRKIMARQIASTVRWFEIIQKMMAEEVRVFIEVGPKNVLTGLLKKIIPVEYEHRCFQFDTPEGLTKMLREL
ncbi:MAG TPA: [acyl-carrier-protein] S-malonyltransferase [Desulfobulbaceae bacterium]|nr:MAG: [acyl-carrier-protein] S-malonyltransferase [Deltaproteobacteria bacterium RIFOXYD12_FULL_53_23]HCC53978.1 [acyl-carrier-protein] S-malonyltransferase [Desulfobulbaceae bacterium]